MHWIPYDLKQNDRMMKKALFILLAFILVFSSCTRRKKYPETTLTQAEEVEVVESTIVKEGPLKYAGVSFNVPPNWSADTSMVDDATYKIELIPPSHNPDIKLVINIHNSLLKESVYMEQLKQQVKLSSKTKNARFDPPLTSDFKGRNAYTCSFSADYKNEDYLGNIIIFHDGNTRRTYSIFYVGKTSSNDDFYKQGAMASITIDN